MKRFALLGAIVALALVVWGWRVVPHSPLAGLRSEADTACRCHGCGCKGGAGWRGPFGQCVSHASLTKICGSPPGTRCTYEGAQPVCRRSGS
ncbi:hypothetical protein XH93_05235 [Bradyrhizobium sp. CCBAU 51753]|nr:hypothetical protein XH93_05235 [Bradyrhizobium sp. CCBAU 51753]